MYVKLFFVAILSFVLSFNALAQTPDSEITNETSAEIKQQAAEMLGETSQMIANLNSPENRVMTTVKVGDTLWNFDETQARQMFQWAMGEIRRTIAQVDSEINQISNSPEIKFANAGSIRELRTRFSKIFSMRTNLANALSNHDAEWAAQFVRETGKIVTSPELRQRFEQTDKTLLATLEKKAAANDITTILKLGREKLSKGVSYESIETLRQVYRKDAEKGAAFGKEILSKMKSSNLNSNSTWILLNLIRQGTTNSNANSSTGTQKPPIFDEDTLREMARTLADSIISPSNRTTTISPQITGILEKYAPEKLTSVSNAVAQRTANRSGNARGSVNSASRRNSDGLNSIFQKMNQARSESQQEIGKSLEKLTDESITQKEKLTIIEETRSRILAITDDALRVSNLLRLANTAAKLDENDLASSLLADAERSVNLQPKDRTDFSANRNLAAAYAEINPERTFAILENMIFLLNNVVEGYIKFGEFNGNGRMIENGELLIGNSSRQFTNYVNLPSATIETLAETDFARLKNLADKFSRPEMRVEVRLQIVGALLGNNRQINSDTGRVTPSRFR